MPILLQVILLLFHPLLGRITRILTKRTDGLLARADSSIHRQFHNSETKVPSPWRRVASLARERWIIRWPLRPPVNETSRHSPLSFSPSFLPSFGPMSERACDRAAKQRVMFHCLSDDLASAALTTEGRKHGEYRGGADSFHPRRICSYLFIAMVGGGCN